MMTSDVLRFFLALAMVLILIGLLAWFVRHFRIGGFMSAVAGSGRIGIVQTLAIAPRQRLILIRRDDREHLLLIGHDREQVVERDIRPPGGAALAADPAVGMRRE